MGMYSYVTDCEITVKNPDDFYNWLEDKEVPYYVPEDYQKNYMYYKEKLAEHYDEGKYFDAYVFDGMKIIQYWYEEFVYILRDLAMFLEGYIELVYEENNEWAKLIFKDGNVFIKKGAIGWSEDEYEIAEWRGIEPLPNKEKLLRSV